MRRKIIKLAAFFLAQGITSAYAGLPMPPAPPSVDQVINGLPKPGVYGRIEFGSLPPPPVLYPQPTVIVRQPRPVAVEPIYLHVPPGHAKHWDKHCRKYNACNRPVYFVKSEEYDSDYGHHHKKKKHKHKHHGHDDD